MNIIMATSLSKIYEHPQSSVSVFSNLNLNIPQGKSLAITGESGRGKTTLLYLLSGLEQASAGEVLIQGQDIQALSEEKLAHFRATYFGFVFQHHFLLNDLNALDNTLLPLRITKSLTKTTLEETKELFEYLKMGHRMNHRPDELSGGEKQRLAIIRALVHKPLVIFADEPTGFLDKENALNIEDLLFDIIKKQNATLILSTHNQKFAQKCDLQYTIDDLEVQ